MTTSPTFHDATLLGVQVDWAAGTCCLNLALSPAQAVVLEFQGLTELFLPRQAPWGRSASVNAFRMPAPQSFELEMQSGDCIRIAASGWSSRAA